MSKIDQVNNRLATLSLSSRCDARHLATLAIWWRKKGEHIQSTSQLVRVSLETMAEMLVLAKEVDFIPTQSDATQLLKEMALLTDTIQRKNMLEALIAEGKVPNALGVAVASPNPVTKASMIKGKTPSDSPEVLAAQTLLEEKLSSDLQDRVVAEQERSKGLFETLGTIPPVE